MKLVLKNVGIIESASIDLNGLTVIAGNNDTGKSTVGKIAYSLTKAYEDFEVETEREKNRIIARLLREVYTTVRADISFINQPKIREFFHRVDFFGRRTSKNIPQIIDEGRIIIEKEKIGKDIKNKVLELFNNIETVYKRQEAKNIKIITFLNRILMSEFKNQIINLGFNTGEIEVYDGESKIITFMIKEGKNSVDLKDQIFPFESSTFIETPFILTYKDIFDDVEEIRQEIYHLDDLLKKMKNSAVYNEKEESGISKIIEGNIIFDEKTDSFEFKKKVKDKLINIDIMNVASGIKNFGLLQLLERSGEFKKKTLLIIDEPEVHLHPDWQVEYAKVLVSLVKRGVRVLVTSHSPYLIEALSKYSKEAGLTEKTRFYLAEKTENGNAVIKDKTKDKDEIFEKLSKPFERLIFEE